MTGVSDTLPLHLSSTSSVQVDEAAVDDWVGRPKPWRARASVNLRARLDLAGQLAKTVGSAFTRDNVMKAVGRLKKGEVGLLLSSMRNIVAQRIALAFLPPPSPIEQYLPLAAPAQAPLVSIVIPCFNDGRYVIDSTASALAQTFTDIEVIIVDGGSTDGTTPGIVESLAGPRVRALVRTDGRHLPGSNRNFGIAAARGRYVCCLDADDCLDPTYVEKMLFILEYRGYDAGSASLRQFGARTGTWSVPQNPTLDDFRTGNQMLVCALFRRSLWVAAGGFRDTGLGRDHIPEDWDFWIRLGEIGARFRNISTEFLLNYRVRDKGASVSSHSEILPLAQQHKMLLAANAGALTKEARQLSRWQAARQLRPSHPDVAMRQAMRKAATADRRPTLLLAIPFFTVGGAERLLSAVISGLAERGWRVTVVSTEFEHASGGDALPWFSAHAPESYALPRFLPPEDWRDFLDYLLGSRRPDVLMIAGSRFVYDLLPAIAAEYPTMARLDLLFNTEGHVAKHLEHREWLTGALCENTTVLQWLREEARWPDTALRCVPSGVDTVRHQPGPRPAAIADALSIAPNDIVVGWSGRLSEEKAPEVFLDLAARCRDLAHVVFVMTGGGRLADRIAAQASRLPAGTRLHIQGLVDDITAYYRLYDIYALTSSLDGRPLAVMEAQASGCAILASRIGGVPEIVVDGETAFLAKPADAADFERALRAMVRDRTALNAMRTAAAQFANAKLSANAMMDGYDSALRDAAAIMLQDPAKGLPRLVDGTPQDADQARSSAEDIPGPPSGPRLA